MKLSWGQGREGYSTQLRKNRLPLHQESANVPGIASCKGVAFRPAVDVNPLMIAASVIACGRAFMAIGPSYCSRDILENHGGLSDNAHNTKSADARLFA